MSLFDTFAADSAIILNEIGRDIGFRGLTVKAICAEPNPADMLTIGGFSGAGNSQAFKLLRATYAAQPIQEGELIIFDGKTWVVASVDTRPLAPWVRVECKRWDA